MSTHISGLGNELAAVQLYFSCRNKAYENMLRAGIRGVCRSIEIAIVENPAQADILISDAGETFVGMPPLNGQIFAIPHRHAADLPPHFRTLNANNPLRTLASIVYEKARKGGESGAQNDPFVEHTEKC